MRDGKGDRSMRYIALLRAVNVGGRSLAMVDLRRVLAELALEDVQTVLQSGNVVFRSTTLANDVLERRLERALAKRLDLQTDVFVRSAPEWKRIVARNPFTDEARRDPGHLAVIPLKAAPSAEQVEALRAAIVGRELVRAEGREAYIVFPDGMGRSRLTPRLIEKHLGRGTARNWNTVLRLAALAES